MSVFVLVPFMELLLPVALKLFPQMLPSTFAGANEKAAKHKRDLKARLEYATFLQETMSSLSSKLASKDQDVGALKTLLQDAREGKRIPTEKIIAVAALFRDEVTLDSLQRPQLVTMCKYMNINPIGPSEWLRFRLFQKIEDIKQEDHDILKEGVENLSLEYLKNAIRARGMRSTGLTRLGYERNLRQWLRLSVDPQVPITLLILSRAFAISELRPVSPDALLGVIVKLPERASSEALLDATSDDTRARLDAIAKVEDDLAEDHRDAVPSPADQKSALVEKVLSELPSLSEEITESAATSALARERQQLEALRIELEEVQAKKEMEKKQLLDLQAELAQLNVVKERLSKEKQEKEAQKLLQQKQAAQEAAERSADLSQGTEAPPEIQELEPEHDSLPVDQAVEAIEEQIKESQEAQTPESKKTKTEEFLAARVASIVEKAEKQMEASEVEIGEQLPLLDTDCDGFVSEDELKEYLKISRPDMGQEAFEEMLALVRTHAADSDIDLSAGYPLSEFQELLASTKRPKKVKKTIVTEAAEKQPEPEEAPDASTSQFR
jgi:LETM1 and EF-hand domain-containing protein 1